MCYQSAFSIHRGEVPGPLPPQWTPKSVDAQVPYRRWFRAMYSAGPWHLWTQNPRTQWPTVFLEKKWHISGPTWFKRVCSRAN